MKIKFSKIGLKALASLLLVLSFCLVSESAMAQSNAPAVTMDSIYNVSSGYSRNYEQQTFTFVVPTGVEWTKIQCYGAGASGAYATDPGFLGVCKSVGGGGGAYASDSIAVNAGDVLTISVGVGGDGAQGKRHKGGNTEVKLNDVLVVKAVGAPAVTDNQTSPYGLGGAASNCIGSVRHSGGHGGLGHNNWFANAGGGGGGADRLGDGGNAADGTEGGEGGVAGLPRTVAGKGGNGASSYGSGHDGTGIGAGGGGVYAAMGYNGNGGNGGHGCVILTYNTCNAATAGSIQKQNDACQTKLINQTSASGSAGSYLWETSATGVVGTWTLIQGAANEEYVVTDTAYYRRGFLTTCGNTVYTDAVYVEPIGNQNVGYVSLSGFPATRVITVCKNTTVNESLQANGYDIGTDKYITWQWKNEGSGVWIADGVDELITSTHAINIPTIVKQRTYRYYYKPFAGCTIYSSNMFTIALDEAVVTRPDFYFDTTTVDVVMIYGACDTTPYIHTPEYSPTSGVTLTNNKSASANEGNLLGTHVVPGTYTIDWTVSDCGESRTFTRKYVISYPECGGDFTVRDVDGNEYSTVRVGCECWMKENLKTKHYALQAMQATPDTVLGSMVYVNRTHQDTAANELQYGRLYTWYAAVKLAEGSTASPVADAQGHVHGVCPNGWYLPTAAQFQALNANEMRDLRSTNLWLDGMGTNATQFTLLPGGCFNSVTGRCESLLGNAYFWSAVEFSATHSYTFMADCNCSSWIESTQDKHNALSIRCVKGND